MLAGSQSDKAVIDLEKTKICMLLQSLRLHLALNIGVWYFWALVRTGWLKYSKRLLISGSQLLIAKVQDGADVNIFVC